MTRSSIQEHLWFIHYFCLCSVISWLASNCYSLCALQILGCSDDPWVCGSGSCPWSSDQWRKDGPDQAVDLREKRDRGSREVATRSLTKITLICIETGILPAAFNPVLLPTGWGWLGVSATFPTEMKNKEKMSLILYSVFFIYDKNTRWPMNFHQCNFSITYIALQYLFYFSQSFLIFV